MIRVIKKAKYFGQKSFAAIVFFLTITIAVHAQQAINSIEVLVNDEPISSFDINQRLRLVIAISGGVRSEEEFLKVREQVISSMVDERLQLQEASTVDLVIDDAQLDNFFARRAQGVGQTPDQFEQALTSIGSSKTSMTNQMEAEFAWSQLVEGRLGPFVSVSEEEVDARIQKIFSNRGKFEYRLAEITLDVSSPEQEASVKANAEQLAERIRAGSAFNEIAQQLSSSPTAAVGGDLGWSTLDDLSGAYALAVNTVKVGDVTDPIQTPGGFVIITVIDRRRVLVADPLDTQVALRQLHLTPALLDNTEAVTKYKNAVENLHNRTLNCDSLEATQANAGADGRLDIGVIRLRDLQGEARSAIENLEVNKATPLLTMEDGMRVLVVCGRQEPQVQEPDFDLISQQLEQQRLSMMGRRYLRDLRRDAIVDYR